MKPHPRPEPATAGDATRLGEELREARLAQGLALEDVEAALRIRAFYLEALEEGRLRDLPAPIYALGYVRSYAGALGLDGEDFARRFREAGGPVAGVRTELVFPEPVAERGVPAGAVALVGAVLALGAYAGWYAWSGSGPRLVDSVPPVPRALELAARDGAPRPEAMTPAATPAPPSAPFLQPPSAPTSAAAAPAAGLPRVAPPPAAPAGQGEGRIVLRTRAEAWVQVRAGQGGPVLINRVLQPGESWTAPAAEGLLLSTGNAGALEFLVDGQPVPGFGATRAVRRSVPIGVERLKAGPIPPVQ